MADSRATAGSIPVQNQDWLVGNHSGAGAAAALWIGSAGLLILGVIPILYGALLDERRITLAELGPIATVETLLIGVSSAVAAMLFSARICASNARFCSSRWRRSTLRSLSPAAPIGS